MSEDFDDAELCLSSERQDKVGAHSWRFDGDDPYTICTYCGQVRDAISGRIVKRGRS